MSDIDGDPGYDTAPEKAERPAAMTTPRIGDNVRIVGDRGTGTAGAIGRVLTAYTVPTEPAGDIIDVVQVQVGEGTVHVWASEVEVVHYDRDTRTWLKGRS